MEVVRVGEGLDESEVGVSCCVMGGWVCWLVFIGVVIVVVVSLFIVWIYC